MPSRFRMGAGIRAVNGARVTGNVAENNDDFGLVLVDSSYKDNHVFANGAGTVTGGINAGGNACGGNLTCP